MSEFARLLGELATVAPDRFAAFAGEFTKRTERAARKRSQKARKAS